MKKVIIAFSAVLLLVVGYNMWGGDAPHSTEGSVETDEGFGSTIKKSFGKIMPGKSESQSLGKYEASDHVVVIESRPDQIEVDDAIRARF